MTLTTDSPFLYSDKETGRYFIALSYEQYPNGTHTVLTKQDVTDQVKQIISDDRRSDASIQRVSETSVDAFSRGVDHIVMVIKKSMEITLGVSKGSPDEEELKDMSEGVTMLLDKSAEQINAQRPALLKSTIASIHEALRLEDIKKRETNG